MYRAMYSLTFNGGTSVDEAASIAIGWLFHSAQSTYLSARHDASSLILPVPDVVLRHRCTSYKTSDTEENRIQTVQQHILVLLWLCLWTNCDHEASMVFHIIMIFPNG